jgi:hypothetical protein
LTASALDSILPQTPSGDATNDDDDDDDDNVGGLHLPKTPETQLPRGIKPGSGEEKRNDLDDLAARFERLKRGY